MANSLSNYDFISMQTRNPNLAHQGMGSTRMADGSRHSLAIIISMHWPRCRIMEWICRISVLMEPFVPSMDLSMFVELACDPTHKYTNLDCFSSVLLLSHPARLFPSVLGILERSHKMAMSAVLGHWPRRSLTGLRCSRECHHSPMHFELRVWNPCLNLWVIRQKRFNG